MVILLYELRNLSLEIEWEIRSLWTLKAKYIVKENSNITCFPLKYVKDSGEFFIRIVHVFFVFVFFFANQFLDEPTFFLISLSAIFKR